MKTWQKRGLRALFSGAFVLALMLGGTSVPAANAAAIGDTFDPYPKFNWSFENNANYAAGGFDYNQGTALSAPNNAWLAATSGWSAIRLWNFNLPYQEPGMNVLCTASIYIKPAVNDSVTFNLEILKPNSYEYIALKQVTALKGSYKWVSVDWRSKHERVTVRFSLLSNNGYYKKARLDNFHIQCVHSPL
jgi:hypothetical protein